MPIQGIVTGGRNSAFKIEFVDADELDSEKVPDDALATTANPFVPGFLGAGSLDAFGGSSIFVLADLLGGRLEDYGTQHATAEMVLRDLWPPARLLYESYLAENWAGFDRIITKTFSDWNLPREATAHARTVSAHQPMLAVTWNMVPPSAATEQFLHYFHEAHLEAVRTPAYNELVKKDGDAGQIQALQRGVFDALQRFIVRYEMWAIGGLPRLMNESRYSNFDRLTLARDEFDETGPLFQHAFEAISKTLRYPVAAQNTVSRGDPNDFGNDHPPSVDVGSRPKNLRQFDRLSNAYKIAYVGQVHEWQAFCSILDNKVRNGIGHAAVRHDLRSGRVVSEKDPVGVNYISFLTGVYEIFDALSVTLQVLRSVRISSSRDWPSR